MTPQDHVTMELLLSTRRELDARIKQNRAEVDGAVGSLATEVRAMREAQVHEWADLRGALDALNESVQMLGRTVDAMDDEAAITKAVASFKRTIVRTAFATIPVAAAVAGAVAAWIN